MDTKFGFLRFSFLRFDFLGFGFWLCREYFDALGLEDWVLWFWHSDPAPMLIVYFWL